MKSTNARLLFRFTKNASPLNLSRNSVFLLFGVIFLSFFLSSISLFAQEIDSEAQSLYNQALKLQKAGKLDEAADVYFQSIRRDRTVLVLNDFGLVKILRDNLAAQVEKDPENLQLLESLGFVSATAYSDAPTAIKCYEKIMSLTDDPGVKAKTSALIEHLRYRYDMRMEYQQAVREERQARRLREWEEMDRLAVSAQESAYRDSVSMNLSEAYATKSDLENRIPQLESEVEDLKDAIATARRLWHSTNNEIYESRRRRYERELAEKDSQLQTMKSTLAKAETDIVAYEGKVNSFEAEEEAKQNSPFQSYADYQYQKDQQEASGVTSSTTTSSYDDDDEDNYVVFDNSGGDDFGGDDMSDEDYSSKLEDLINSL